MKKIMMIVGCSLIVAGCYNDKYDKLYPSTTTVVTCDTTNITFSHDIMPIFASSCNTSGCHDAAGGSITGFDFTTYAGIQAEVATGNILNDINWVSGHNQMPKDGTKLSDCNISKITRWIHQGALNN